MVPFDSTLSIMPRCVMALFFDLLVLEVVLLKNTNLQVLDPCMKFYFVIYKD